MEKAQWLSSNHPAFLLHAIRDRAPEHDLRRFAVACCRRIGHLDDQAFSRLLKAMEAYLDGRVGPDHVAAAREDLQRAKKLAYERETDDTPPLERFDYDAAEACLIASDLDGTFTSSARDGEPGSAYSAAVLAARNAAQSIGARAGNSLADDAEVTRVDMFLAAEGREQSWQAQKVRDMFDCPSDLS